MTRRKKVPLLQRYRLRFARKRPPTAMWEALLVIMFGAVLIYTYSFAKKFTYGEETAANDTAQIVRVQVLNGCGIPGAASEVAEFLLKNGAPHYHFDPVDEGNFATFDVTETLVLDRGESMETAREIAALLGVDSKNVITQALAQNVLDIEVTVLIGRDFAALDLNGDKRSP
jgi:hypothetical protein